MVSEILTGSESIPKALNSFERLGSEAVSLRIVEKFLCEVERSILRPASEMFDIGTIKSGLQEIKKAADVADSDDLSQAEFRLKQEFDRWRAFLIEKDDGIEAFHMRRFCDSTRSSLSSNVFLALARFYRHLSISQASQSKFDLFITRAYSSSSGGNRRYSVLERAEIVVRVHSLYKEWDGVGEPATETNHAVDSAISAFDAFIAEAEGLSEFENLVESNLFERIRGFKRDLGQTYFHPEVVAAAIECNLTVGNAFADLLGDVNEELGDRLGSQFDFAGALLDASGESEISVAEALSKLISIDPSATLIEAGDELVFFRNLLNHASARAAESEDDLSENDAEEVNVTEHDPRPVKERLADVLIALSNPQPDTKILRKYMKGSVALDVLDLNDYLFSDSGEPDVLGRRALAAILCLEEIREHDLKGTRSLSPELGDEVLNFLHFAEVQGEAIGDAIQTADQRSQNRLLLVSNKLLSTRLKLERSIVRFSGDFEAFEAAKKPQPAPEPGPDLLHIEITRGSLAESNRWLIAGTVAATLICGSILFFSSQTSVVAALPEDVEMIALKRLPHPENLVSAHRMNDTLYITAEKKWERLSEEDKRKNLQELVEVQAGKQMQNVVVIDGEGRPLGDLSPEGLNILHEPPMPIDSQ